MKFLIVQGEPVSPNAWIPDLAPPLACQVATSLSEGILALNKTHFDGVITDLAALEDTSHSFREIFQRTQSPECLLFLGLSQTDEVSTSVLSDGIDGYIDLPFQKPTFQNWAHSLHNQNDELIHHRAELNQREEEIATLIAMSDIITSNLEFIPLLAAIAQQTSKALDAERTSIFMYEPKDHRLQAAYAEGLGPYSISIPATHGVVGYVATKREMVNVVNAYQDKHFYNEIDHGTGYTTHTILCTPLISPIGDLIGVVQCLNKRDGTFTKTDERILSLLSPLFAVSIENALLFRDLQEEVKHNEEMTAEKIQSERLAIVGRMARSVTRDIAGPMEEIVDAAARLGREDITDPERDETCRDIEHVVDHLVGLAQELLDFSRERIELMRDTFDIKVFAGMVKWHFDNQDLTVETTKQIADTDREIHVDADKINEALVCLANVMDHFEPISRRLIIDLNETGIQLTFSNLSTDTIEKIMYLVSDPFANMDEEQTVSLKMAVAERVIAAHNGSIIEGQHQNLIIQIPDHLDEP